jgi:hypothetical protein
VDDASWEEVTEQLLQAQREVREKAHRRLAAAQDEATAADRGVEAIEVTLAMYRTSKRAADTPPVRTPNVSGATEYVSPDVATSVVHTRAAEGTEDNPRKSYPEVITDWAASHDGLITMRQITKELADRGMFKDERTAQGALYPAVRRLVALENAKKLGRGVYKVLGTEAGPPTAPITPGSQQDLEDDT